MPDDDPAAESGQDNLTRLVDGEREIFLVGTAHISRQSVDEVRSVIDRLRPDSVCVELDSARYQALLDEGRAPVLDVRDVLRRERAGLVLASLLFAGFQKRLGDRLGVKPGAEMLAAAKEAAEVGAEVVLADREIQTTLERCYESLGFVDRAKVAFVLVMLPFAAGDIDAQDVENLKNRQAISDVMETFAREMPALERPLIHERDKFLVAKTRGAKGRRIVSVVGAAHVPGMVRNFRSDIDLPALSATPPVRSRRVSTLALPLGCALALALSWLKSAHSSGANAAAAGAHLLAVLAVPTAGAATLAAAGAGAGAWTALSALVVAPATLLVPFVSLGRVAGTVETRARPPSPNDALRVRGEILLPKLARKNAVLRPLLVAVFTPVGRTVGFAVGVACALVCRLLF